MATTLTRPPAVEPPAGRPDALADPRDLSRTGNLGKLELGRLVVVAMVIRLWFSNVVCVRL